MEINGAADFMAKGARGQRGTTFFAHPPGDLMQVLEEEKYGEQGMVDEAQKALEEAEALKKLPARQEPILDSSKYTAADVRIVSEPFHIVKS
nr:putative RNA-binding protein Luc7-like 2 [Ipomoea batatas]